MADYFNIYYVVCLIWYLAFLGIMAYLYFNDSKPYISEFKEKIYMDFPSNLSPAELSNLMYKKITPEVFTATIMLLIKKGILNLKSENEDYVLSLNKETNLPKSEKAVLNILLNDIGNGEKVTLKEIEGYCKGKRNCSEFLLNYQVWNKIVIKEIHETQFFEQKLEYNQVKSMRILGIILFILNILFSYHSFIGYFIIIPAFFVVFYFSKIFKRTREANEEYVKWLAFKQYLEHIEEFKYNENNINDYVIYGIVLGVLDVEKKLINSDFVQKLNELIRHNVIIANLNGNRGFGF